MILYRPVGLEELQLVYRSGMRQFPPRLPEQPIFYPVLVMEYAEEISRRWNAPSGSMAGYVTEFEVDEAYGRSFEVHQVGARQHRELWVPAEALDEFNSHIQGQIRLIGACFGPAFRGVVPSGFSLRGKDATAQLESLQGIHGYNLMDFHGEISANHEAIFANFPYWEQLVSEAAPELEHILAEIRQVWARASPAIPLGPQTPRPTRIDSSATCSDNVRTDGH